MHLSIIQEGICLLFAQSKKEEHGKFRTHIVEIYSPIDDILELIIDPNSPFDITDF